MGRINAGSFVTSSQRNQPAGNKRKGETWVSVIARTKRPRPVSFQDTRSSKRKGELKMAEATLKEIREFFGMDVKTFRQEWTALSDKDKKEIREGMSNGSMTY